MPDNHERRFKYHMAPYTFNLEVIMMLPAWMYKVLALVLNGVATVTLFVATAGIIESPADPEDTSGIPVISMYLVILIFLAVVSLASLVLGFIVNRLSKSRPLQWIGSFLEVVPLSFTGLLGVLVSFAYNHGEILGYVSILLYLLSVFLMMIGWRRSRTI
ncbi:hypothetical protein NJF44_17885 [Pseudomonas guariconensis]|uniref:hypothetical protein n=1 Tax=Pseudomonas TaxID=286 RepID=UPI0020983C03|nr:MULTISPECIES: hypothetical protein [Pseudomonas]MCO7635316.1 hypothetical protein [Pseudomonas sp. S 311-6]MCO7516703.1 hypothetical protein [Pseudomonas putida]MCO7563660.1 hypothetical protein [Pseudomonas mosselii]MCO7607107.1 hypothetical protein [Pseudomonas guariconensis]MCO7618187.1 hypothetical protein [Pseudomonas guariconensis]